MSDEVVKKELNYNDFIGLGVYGHPTAQMRQEKYQEIITQLKSENENINLCGLNDLATHFSVTTELGRELSDIIDIKDVLVLIFNIIKNSSVPFNHLTQVMSLSCITRLFDLAPQSVEIFVDLGGEEILENLLSPIYLDVFEFTILCIEKILELSPHVVFKDQKDGIKTKLLEFIDFLDPETQKSVKKILKLLDLEKKKLADNRQSKIDEMERVSFLRNSREVYYTENNDVYFVSILMGNTWTENVLKIFFL